MFTVDTNSWHFKMTRFTFEESQVLQSSSFCQYATRVLLSFGFFCLVTYAVVTLALYNVIGVFAAFYGVWTPVSLYGVLNVSTIISAMVGIIVYICYHLVGRMLGEPQHPFVAIMNRRNRPPGFFATWYHSVKNKVCVPIQFKRSHT